MKTGKTLVELATEIERRANSKKDLVASTKNLAMGVNAGGDVALSVGKDHIFNINAIAHAQIGEHTEIHDARDRYANLQTSYLLQRLESFEGISILATNLQKNIDEAFLRRIDLVVDFPTPGKADRLALWKRIEQTTNEKGNARVSFGRLAPGSHTLNVCELEAGC